ncbi:MAG: DoxX family protein [Candidatus Omnitrophota bacterium]
MKFSHGMKKILPKNEVSVLVLRLGLGIVFLVFGIGKFRGDEWAQTMQNMAFFSYLPWSVNASIALAGAAEIITGCCLIAGLFLCFFSWIAACQIVAILILLFVQDIVEIRDFGLLAMAVALALSPPDRLSLDHWRKHFLS